MFGGADIIVKLLGSVHSRQHYRYFRLIPQPFHSPGSRRNAGICFAKQINRFFRDTVCKSSAQQRLHNNHRQAFFVGLFQSEPSRLIVFVHVVVLDLAKIPRVHVKQFQKRCLCAVERKPDGTNLSASLLFGQPFFQTDCRYRVPSCHIGDVMN